MATITDSGIVDLANGTLKRLGRGRFQQIAQRLREYDVMGRMAKKDRIIVGDGNGIQRNLMITHTNNAKQVGLFQVDEVRAGSHSAQISVGWKHTTVNMAWDRRELLMNRGESEIFSLFKMRYANMILDLADHMETLFWQLPASATGLEPFGVPYWVVKPGSAEEGFVGGDPYVGVGAGGLLVANAPGWKNYGADYETISDADALKKMRKAFRKVGFKSVRAMHADYKQGDDDMRIYANDDTVDEMEDILRRQNDNLGRDLARYQNETTFMQKPVRVCEQLNADTSDPIYMLNFAYFHLAFLEGDYMRETGAIRAPEQHNVWNNHMDLTWQTLCVDRRRQAVLAKI